MMFVVLDRNVDVYRRIKKSCDIRFGVASQVMQSKHVLSASPQYISNVCMKVNAKLGGATSIAKSTLSKLFPHCPKSITMLIVASSQAEP
jgi:eukaryotic translation initiation factor 2C